MCHPRNILILFSVLPYTLPKNIIKKMRLNGSYLIVFVLAFISGLTT
ncbi:hypothetical protein PROPEN_01668 [Proteus penneri ATCC 35198]|nr:hypothetical protein PROPEN_01668 [Proteus penneri ATCC 35198]